MVEFGKQKARIEGMGLIFMGLLFEAIVIIVSLTGKITISPLLFLVGQLFPIVTLEAGVYRIIKSRSFSVTEIDVQKSYGGAFNKVLNYYLIFSSALSFIIFVVFGLIILSVFGYLILSNGLLLTEQFTYTLFFILIYIFIIRWGIIFYLEKIRSGKLYYLVNPAFLISILFILVGLFLIVSVIPGIFPIFQLSPIIRLLIGLGVITISGIILYDSLQRGVKYQITKDCLFLFGRYNVVKEVKIEIPIRLIQKYSKISYAESASIVPSAEMVAYRHLFYLNDLNAIIKEGKKVIPRYWIFSTSGGKDYLFLEGKGFTYVLKVEDAAAFIFKLNTIKK